MKLTQAQDPPGPDTRFPFTQLLILATCRLAEPIAVTAIFPYAWLMVKDFGMDDASFYAGILIASFSLSESLSSMFWGGVSDRVGRKPVLLCGCVGTMASLLVVGLSTNFPMALAGRILGGALNGNIGVIQTMVGEIVTNPRHEPRAYAIMPFVWSIGTILGPAVGGMLANPTKSYPTLFPKGGLFDHFPYLLPNLVCCAFLAASIAAAYFVLSETHPHFRPGSESRPNEWPDVTEHTPMITAAGATADPAVDLRHEAYGTFNEVEAPTHQRWEIAGDGTSRTPSLAESTREKWLTPKVAMLTIALGLFTYHSMCYDHLLPIFFQDRAVSDISILQVTPFHIPGGLGLSTKDVGLIMSVNGLIALLVQAVVFPLAAECLGVWQVFVVVTVLHPLAYFIVPYLALLPRSYLYPGIYTCLTIRNLLSILAYPVLLILLKQASPSAAVLGRINGLAASAGAACRTIAPPVAGLLYEYGTDIGFCGLAWWGAGAVAILGSCQLWLIPRERNETSVVHSAIPCFEHAETKPSDVVDVVDVVVFGACEP